MPHPLTIFIYEYLTGGACPDVPLDSSLMTEGRAMADAIIADFSALDEVQVVTLRDNRLPVVDSPNVITRFAEESADGHSRFCELCAAADRVLVIAPETGGVLAEYVELARRANPDGVLNGNSDTLQLGSDKWELSQRLNEWDIPTIPTQMCDGSRIRVELPFVIKPRDGAGCEGVRVLRDDRGLVEENQDLIVQPLLEGVALSSATCFSAHGQRLITLPLGQQFVEIGTTIRYRGGEIPWQDARRMEAERQAEHIWRKLEQKLSGLAGYVGIDWLWHEQTETLLVVELNPRLTTAYVGYRELSGGDIVTAILGRAGCTAAVSQEPVRFAPDGTIAARSTGGAAP